MLTNESSSRQTYVNVTGGKFTVKAKEGDEGAVKRTKKTGEDVWEKQYEKVSGTITNFVKED